MNSFIFTDFDSLSLSIDNKAFNVTSDHQNWDAILDALKVSNFAVIPGLINLASQAVAYVATAPEGFNNIIVNSEYGTITYAGQTVHSGLVDHIFRMKEQGFPITPMLKFLDNLFDNPSKRAVDELYSFLQYGKMPITEDGCFLAYKRVRADYLSVHDGKTDNSIGVTVQMPRNMVNENSEQTCSTGLHFCSFEYLKSFSGAKIVVLKVNPRDVVSIPADYNNTKGRACRYEVISELSEAEFNAALNRNIFTEAVRSETGAKVEVPKTNLDPVYEKTEVKAYTNKLVANGAKVGKGAFYDGYTQGYTDADRGMDYFDGNKYNYDTVGREEAYEQGYIKGWDDANEGVSRRYVKEDLAASLASNLISVSSQDGPSLITKQHYATGYKDGRKRVLEALPFNADYMEGYKDGKAHKSRKYPL